MNPTEILEKADIRPTANRILVVKSLIESTSPMSLNDLEIALDPMEKSSIFRVLTTLLEHSLVHALEDGRGVVKYELCTAEHHGDDHDMHAHFYCEKCQQVICLETVPALIPPLPNGFRVKSVNYMLKGLCNKCTAGSLPVPER